MRCSRLAWCRSRRGRRGERSSRGRSGWSPWGGLVVALNPGLVFAVYSDTSETLGAALLLLAFAAYADGRRGWAAVLLAALCFDKEPLVLVPLAIAAWELWRTRRLPALAAAVVPAALLVALPADPPGERFRSVTGASG